MDDIENGADWDQLLRGLPADLRAHLAGVDQQAADPVRRRHLRQTEAVKCGVPDVARRLAATAAGAPDRWRPAWVTSTEPDARHVGGLDGHEAAVRAVATTAIDGHPVALTADGLGVLATWDLASGGLLGTGIRATDEGPVLSVAAAELDGRPVAVTGGYDGKIRVWDLLSQSLVASFAGHAGIVWSVATTVLGSRPAVVSGGADRTVRVWDLLTGAALRPPEPSYGEVTAVAAGVFGGRPWVFGGDDRGWIMSWALDTGEAKAGAGHHDGVLAAAVTEDGGRALGISSSHDSALRVWDLATGEQVGEGISLKAAAWSLAVLAAPAGPVLAAALADGDVAFIDLRTRETAHEPVRGHDDKVYAVAAAELDGHPIVVSGGADGMAQVWDLAARTPDIGCPLPAHGVRAVAAAASQAPGGPAVAVVGDSGGALWLRDVRSGALLAGPLAGHTGVVASPAVALLDGTPVAVTASADQTVRIWDLNAGTQLGAPLIAAASERTLTSCLATAVLRGRPIVATAEAEHPLRVWDLATRRVLAEVPSRQTVTALAAADLGGRPVFVAGTVGGALCLWDAESGDPVGVPMIGYEGPVTAVATAVVDGRPLAVTGGHDGTVRVWDLPACVPMGSPVAVHTDVVRAVAVTGLDGCPVAVSGGDDCAVRTSDLRTGAEAAPPFATAHEVRDLVPTSAGVLVVALDTLLLAPVTRRS